LAFTVVPRHFLTSVLEPRLRAREDDADVCVMWNTVVGSKNDHQARIDVFMWEKADAKKGVSAMSRTTAFPAAIVARFLGKGKIEEKGIVAPEDCIKGQLYQEFISELEKRNIQILVEKNQG